ncbi:hypothetical protein C0V70_14300 [Bacteriovorax stolpii]|uniref:Oxidoreductase NAD-binding domain-containing protein 1 n=1 Tax=Bacteriovorax stolpii TaxID=960 RepID=A0A2K9NWW7_BACTC|nr:FAD-dependent oxidoreductase [Bacteriovorax stolpii]AUN99254.1 hypothetical protein C0V70_14300 [Bacteriovorax stolpii]TDP55206.1 ferredoxin-NADP reductase [Bacteriovorax stolpii]
MSNQPDIFKAIITEVTQVTARIKAFKLEYGSRSYHFKPGQWIDLYAPIEGKNIGGYTITSAIQEKGHITLAVRESNTHPVTQFLHQIEAGQEVMITEGQGKFFLKEEYMNSPLVFIAGGIGVTPLLSMFRSVDKTKTSLKLFYSVSYEEDILFREELAPYSVFTATKGHSPSWQGETTRMNLAMLKKYGTDLGSHFFICGPRPMIDSMVTELKEAGVSADHIHFEKWW